MNRRDFLKLIGATSVASALPVAAVNSLPPPAPEWAPSGAALTDDLEANLLDTLLKGEPAPVAQRLYLALFTSAGDQVSQGREVSFDVEEGAAYARAPVVLPIEGPSVGSDAELRLLDAEGNHLFTVYNPLSGAGLKRFDTLHIERLSIRFDVL